MNHEHTFVGMSGRAVTLTPDDDTFDTEYNVVMTTVVLKPGQDGGPDTAVFKHYIVRRET